MGEPLISILILNYNQINITKAFLESAKGLNYKNYEIILVDNNSIIDPETELIGKYEKLVYIRSNENLGFTGGNNFAYQYSKGEYVFIVNNDTELTPNIIDELLKPFSSPEIGIVCPKIKFYDNPNTIQYAGFNQINPLTGRNSAVGSKEIDEGQYDIPGITHYAHGAAMLVPRKVIEEVGLFPEFFFIYYEELDFSERVKKAGLKIFYQPSAVIYHKESITMGKQSSIKTYYMNRNRVLFMRRNTGYNTFIFFILFFIIFTIPKNTIKYLFNFQFEHLNSFYRGIIWNLLNKANKI